LNDWQNTFLLDGGGLDETITIDTSKNGFLETKIIELFD
jgi:hypothetical protein